MERIFNPSFLFAYDRTSEFEKWYVDHPSDKGGETWRGISRHYWPKWLGWSILDNFGGDYEAAKGDDNLEKLVRMFYVDNFWDHIRGDTVSNISLLVAAELFDSAVLCHPVNAIRFLQIALNRQNNFGKAYPDLIEDGIIGNKTISTLNRYSQWEPKKENEHLLLKCMNGELYIYLVSLKGFETFRGWAKRT